ncbi:YdcF family protein [Staphylococcus lutrae]|nr:YdcF family protein [Staphylococcus lutrae]
MLYATIGYVNGTPRLSLLSICIIMIFIALCFAIGRDFKRYQGVVVRILGYHSAIIALIIGSLLVTPLLPMIFTLPFQLLIQLALVFITTWPFYLYMTYAFLHTRPTATHATIIVLGAGIYSENVTPMLQARLDRAITLSQSLKSDHIIVSGGQGPDEPISEALAMQRYLIQQGMPSTEITMEDRSTNTRENLFYSKPLLTQHEKPYIIVTSAFHLLRALRIAQRQKIHALGYGAPTPHQWVARELIRDFSGLLFQYPLLWGIYAVLQLIISVIHG